MQMADAWKKYIMRSQLETSTASGNYSNIDTALAFWFQSVVADEKLAGSQFALLWLIAHSTMALGLDM